MFILALVQDLFSTIVPLMELKWLLINAMETYTKEERTGILELALTLAIKFNAS